MKRIKKSESQPKAKRPFNWELFWLVAFGILAVALLLLVALDVVEVVRAAKELKDINKSIEEVKNMNLFDTIKKPMLDAQYKLKDAAVYNISTHTVRAFAQLVGFGVCGAAFAHKIIKQKQNKAAKKAIEQ